jgi:hypothetical protein
MCVPGYEVTMFVWVEHKQTEHTLLEPQQYLATVHPPVWTQDDPAALEMWLDHLTKIKFLAELRKCPNPAKKVVNMLAENQFIIRGLLQQWRSPENSRGERKEVVYPPHHLRAA